jgi:uncharacterized membrane protein (UPF0127 family)
MNGLLKTDMEQDCYPKERMVKDAVVCDTFLKRLRGFMFRRNLKPGEALFFPHCACIHTFFMARDLKVVFFDKDMKPVREIPNVPPWRVVFCGSAEHVLEIVK